MTKVNPGTPNEVKILQGLNLDVYDGDFITVLGSNGAGKSTLFNTISGELPVDSGSIQLRDQDITHLSVEKRTAFLARVFQDPKMGTAPRMTVAENLLLASQRGQRRTLKLRQLKTPAPLSSPNGNDGRQWSFIPAQHGNRKLIRWSTPGPELFNGY